MKTQTQHNADTERTAILLSVGQQRDYTGWLREHSDEETRDGQEASYEQWLGKHMSNAAIAEYDGMWQGHHGYELITRRSARKYAGELAEAQTERAA